LSSGVVCSLTVDLVDAITLNAALPIFSLVESYPGRYTFTVSTSSVIDVNTYNFKLHTYIFSSIDPLGSVINYFDVQITNYCSTAVIATDTISDSLYTINSGLMSIVYNKWSYTTPPRVTTLNCGYTFTYSV
jgi:hypothetical protein